METAAARRKSEEGRRGLRGRPLYMISKICSCHKSGRQQQNKLMKFDPFTRLQEIDLHSFAQPALSSAPEADIVTRSSPIRRAPSMVLPSKIVIVSSLLQLEQQYILLGGGGFLLQRQQEQIHRKDGGQTLPVGNKGASWLSWRT